MRWQRDSHSGPERDQRDRRLPAESIRRNAEGLAQHVGWIVLVLALIAVVFIFGSWLADPGIDQILHVWPDWGGHSRLTGIELTIVPLSAIFAAWLRPGADRIQSIRETRSGPWLPLRMAAALVGLSVWLFWSWDLPQASFGPDQFGYARWLGAALAAAFTIFWLPLFPRVTATLAGMIAGPAIFAGLGYLFFESFLTSPPQDCWETCPESLFLSLLAQMVGFVLLGGLRLWARNFLFLGALLVCFISLIVWLSWTNVFSLILFLLLSLALLLGRGLTEPHLPADPLRCAVVSGALAAGVGRVRSCLWLLARGRTGCRPVGSPVISSKEPR